MVSGAALNDFPPNIGRYRVTGQIAHGSFGTVLRARDDDLDRDVAIKVPHAELLVSEAALEAFLTEARILASLDHHPGIVPVYDVGCTEDGLYFLVTKLVEGTALNTRLKSSRFTPTEAVEIVARVAEALQSAHRMGLVHRDVKPANILIDSSGQPMLIDFGLALKQADVGSGPSFVGTMPYMSPEQARHEGHRVDSRTDIYSLGVVLYEMLTGQRPFTGATEHELLERIKTGTPVLPCELNDTLPDELERICLKSMARRAWDRYESARELADDLRHWLKESRLENQGPSFKNKPPSGPASTEPRNKRSLALRPTLEQVVPRGLRSFDDGDANFFLDLLPGPRNRAGLPDSVAVWISRLQSTDSESTFPIGVLYGPSGCGKSSLVKAGLLPRLAKHVTALHVESSTDRTETRLHHALYRRFPSLPPGLALGPVLEALRRGVLPQGQKLVIILDQFEQWLHDHRESTSEELTEALRQCDGGRVQCLLLVRDEFWIPLSRFLGALEVRLEEGVNASLVDLFDPLHARKVLADFGRAYGRLPAGGDVPADAVKFLDESVEGLSEGGKVAPVRLSVFADIVKGKPWTVQTLRAMGGVERVGEAFLEQAFGEQAPPARRQHAGAAIAVLQALLPPPGNNIKGHVRTRDELCEFGGYADLPDAFDELMHTLEHELRLISPAAELAIAVGPRFTHRGSPSPPRTLAAGDLAVADGPEGADAATDSPAGAAYQLTHDYLVPSLRAWLTRQQRETRKGRAALQLAQCAEWWTARPEDRHLPGVWEWVGIRLLTRRRDWTDTQRRMMRRANGYYAKRLLGVAVVLALLAGLGAFEAHRRAEQYRRYEAEWLVALVQNVRTSQWPLQLKKLKEHRRWAEPLLREALEDPSTPPVDRMHVRMALLAMDHQQVGPLLELLLTADADDHQELVAVLQPFRDELISRLWQVLDDPAASPGAQFRAACALAQWDAADQRWARVSGAAVRDLVGHDELFLRSWLPALRTIGNVMIPALEHAFADRAHPVRAELAAVALADYANDRPEVLAALLLESEAAQFRRLWPAFTPHLGRLKEIMERVYDESTPPHGADKDAVARRRIRAAVALLRLGHAERAWNLLRFRPDPRERSFLIHAFAAFDADPEELVQRLDTTSDSYARSAILLALGEFSDAQFPVARRQQVAPRLIKLYRTDPSPSFHAAVEWLLRRWGYARQLDEIDGQLAVRGASATGKSGWFVNGEGIQMVVVEPGEFLMGSPTTEPGRLADETQHRRRVPRVFAIAATEVSTAQFNAFLKEHPVQRQLLNDLYSPDPHCPVVAVTWFLAARYCRWLSEKEGLPEAQMCYPPLEQIKAGMQMPADYLLRTGYRLPTEAEWEYANRAGTTTVRSYGDADDLLGNYAWYVRNANDQTWPGGLKKPNDLGLFDMEGNVWEWCQERYRPYPTPARDQAAGDDEDDVREVRVEDARILRGASFKRRETVARIALRYPQPPNYEYISVGIRVARTCR